MSQFVGEQEYCNCCTFGISKDTPILQPIYVCNTCNAANTAAANKCFCEGCSSACHEGHDIDFLIFGKSYCDCHLSGACALAEYSVNVSARVLSGKERLVLDDLGRIAGTNEFGMNISPFSIHNIIELDSIVQDMTARAVALTSLNKDTFWQGCNTPPTNLFEAMALKIFGYHTQGCNFSGCDMTLCGAEWWLQVKPVDEECQLPFNQQGHSPNIDNGIDLHYDKDEEIAASFGLGVFPQVSTVTYLTACAASLPTCIVENQLSSAIGDPIQKCYISFPEVGKHVAFDGRFLHGAPAMLRASIPATAHGGSSSTSSASSASSAAAVAATAAASSGKLGGGVYSQACGVEGAYRITFLVNVWLNHKPAGVQQLPQGISALVFGEQTNTSASNTIHALEKVYVAPRLQQGNTRVLDVCSADVANYAAQATAASSSEYEEDVEDGWVMIPFISDKANWGKDQDETGLLLKIFMPQEWLQSTASMQGSMIVNYHDSDCAAVLEYEFDEDDIADDVDEALDL